MNTFGNRLRNLRENLGLKQSDIAKYLNCNYKVVSNYELGKREPDFETLVKLCDYFDVTADYLLGRSPSSKNYKQISLDSRATELLDLFLQFPASYQDDILRYEKLNCLEIKYGRKLSKET